jgi:hypothetical protein
MTAQRRPVEYDEDVPHPLARRVKIAAGVLGVLTGIAVALLLLPRLFPGEEQPAPVASVGETVSGEDWTYTVAGVERTDRVDLTGSGDFASAGGDWLIVTVAFANQTADPRHMDLDNFRIRDARGHEFSVARAEQLIYVDEHELLGLEVGPLETRFDAVGPGETVEVPLLFDVEREEAPLRLWLDDEDVGIALGAAGEGEAE